MKKTEMKETNEATIDKILKAQRDYFATHETKSVDFRLNQLKKFKSAIEKNEKKITDALHKDLHKSYEEAYLTEVSIVLQELKNHIKNVKKWSKPHKVSTPLHLLPSRGSLHHEPLGVSLIIAPWNYPFQLLMNPLVGAISAGCCAVLKPSEFTPNTAQVMQEIIAEIFDDNYIALVQGTQETGEALLKKRWDLIFFTGSTAVGKIVMKAAAEHLTPVVLELGGKSPCIVDETANLEIAARRIAWGKTINAGQTCIAPDYLLAHESIKEELIVKITESFEDMFGDEPQESKFYPRIIHEKAFDRLKGLMQDGTVKSGGETDREEKFIAPTVLDNVKKSDPVMQQEIFGPILPVLSYSKMEEALAFINQNEKPLALYYFGKEKNAKEVLTKTTSGGVCINDTLMHITNHHLPFGGVGGSGMGQYHGKESFKTFSNQRAVVKTPTWIDVSFKYAPFKHFKWIRKFV
ncbi:aldehyde dehydrogenase [Salegentibacter sp. F188]|uniref:Aldehyde dehydrogenase n=1 Tax=Autumnicola patrickiae TaxID=3075591 RepID=A0ABU3DYM0_9FLAO|nr:aldehyde dehydrogenase [Salegentibacter sp. F188]MDT0688800.1 aldehyde dehydrogenase [Salegentibacter sp. F188]